MELSVDYVCIFLVIVLLSYEVSLLRVYYAFAQDVSVSLSRPLRGFQEQFLLSRNLHDSHEISLPYGHGFSLRSHTTARPPVLLPRTYASLSDKLLLALASAVIFGFGPSGSHDLYFYVSRRASSQVPLYILRDSLSPETLMRLPNASLYCEEPLWCCPLTCRAGGHTVSSRTQ
jgi:hypothetical protein